MNALYIPIGKGIGALRDNPATTAEQQHYGSPRKSTFEEFQHLLSQVIIAQGTYKAHFDA